MADLASAAGAVPDAVAELRRQERSFLQWDTPREPQPCVLQDRDIEILAALWRYHYLTTAQIAELWWPGTAPELPRRRLARLFRAGYVRRFRPYVNRGSFKWTYLLAREGFDIAAQLGALPAWARYIDRPVHDYRYVLHDLEVAAWVIAYKRLAGTALTAWHGEEEATHACAPQTTGRNAVRVQPDAALEIDTPDGPLTLLVELDRTRRLDKNYPKFTRYDAFLTHGWKDTHHATHKHPPGALFICQTPADLDRFIHAADKQLTVTAGRAGDRDWPARRRTLFVVATDVHAGSPAGWRLPPRPPDRRDTRSLQSVVCQLPTARATSAK